MRALTVQPGVAGSAALEPRAARTRGNDQLLVQPLLVGVCGTDREILAGRYGTAPDGRERLVVGHEAVVRVLECPEGSGWDVGDLAVPIVRRPDPEPCPACAAGEWDMCENGRFTEHGITGADGFALERTTLDPTHVVPVPEPLGLAGVLVEPASVVAKAWDHIDRIGHRASWHPSTALVTGAGPVGLLAALLARQRGLDTFVLDRVESGPKPQLVHELGAHYHAGPLDDLPRPDVVVECTGVGEVVLDAIARTGRNGIVCLAGLSSGGRSVDLDATALNRRLVLENDVVFGSVNANRRHYLAAVDALVAASSDWLARLVTRVVPIDSWPDAVERRPEDVKVVLDLR